MKINAPEYYILTIFPYGRQIWVETNPSTCDMNYIAEAGHLGLFVIPGCPVWVQVPWVSDVALGYGEGESIAEDTVNVIFFLLCLCSKDNSL